MLLFGMVEKHNSKKISLMLLQESLWNIEDKINIFLESIADHEAEIIRLKRFNQLFSERLSKLESNRNHTRTNQNE